MRRLFNSEGGVITMFEGDGNGGFSLISTADLEPAIEENKKAYTSGHDGYTPSRDMQHVAEIPLLLVHKWMIEDGVDVLAKGNEDALRKKLNDHTYRYLRTAPGRL